MQGRICRTPSHNNPVSAQAPSVDTSPVTEQRDQISATFNDRPNAHRPNSRFVFMTSDSTDRYNNIQQYAIDARDLPYECSSQLF
jgi:hypothetical protein